MPPPATHDASAEIEGVPCRIRIGRGVLASLGPMARESVPKAERVLLVHDEALPPTLVESTARSLTDAGLHVARVALAAAEEAKTLDEAGRILRTALDHRLERGEPIVALGGGVVTDLAGFAASIHRRGVPTILAPTTLLGMVDAAIGGKTAVNLAAAEGRLVKNAAGTFHFPRAVVIDLAALDTLPPRQFRAGLAECAKHALLGASFSDPGLLAWLEAHTASILVGDEATLAELVARNVQLKSRVVALDPRERAADPSASRSLLNLGHTFAHALETIPGISPDDDPAQAPLHHGEAVGLGLLAAAHAARTIGLIPAEYQSRIGRLVSSFGLPRVVRELPPTPVIVGRMRDDKKVASSTLRLVLPDGLGHARVVENPPLEAVVGAIDALRG